MPVTTGSHRTSTPLIDDTTISKEAISGAKVLEIVTTLDEVLKALRDRAKGDPAPPQTRASRLWAGANSPFVLFLLSGVFVTIISSLWAERAKANEQEAAQQQLRYESSTEIRYRDAFVSSFLAREISPTDVDLAEQFFLGRGRDFSPALRVFDGASLFGVVSNRDFHSEKRLSAIPCPDSMVAFQKALRMAKGVAFGVAALSEELATPLRKSWQQVRTNCIVVSANSQPLILSGSP